MAFDEQLALRLRAALKPFENEITEKKMFGGTCFLLHGKMTVGIVKDQLMVRVLSGAYEEVLKEEYVKEMDFTGKPLKEFVYVSQEAIPTEFELMRWINYGIEHAKSKLKK